MSTSAANASDPPFCLDVAGRSSDESLRRRAAIHLEPNRHAEKGLEVVRGVGDAALSPRVEPGVGPDRQQQARIARPLPVRAVAGRDRAEELELGRERARDCAGERGGVDEVGVVAAVVVRAGVDAVIDAEREAGGQVDLEEEEAAALDLAVAQAVPGGGRLYEELEAAGGGAARVVAPEGRRG